MSSISASSSVSSQPVAPQEAPTSASCRPAPNTAEAPGEVRCPVCYQIVPPEHIGYKLHCRRCGYLESCCNPY